jgi:NAD(P)-dependent dehydrogenase (short-subunit alcohol dehydrogenase family)
MNRPAEIEFAVRLSGDDRPHEFGFLQMRPLVLSRETAELEIDAIPPERLVVASPRVMGNGRIDDVSDLVVVDFHRFDRSKGRAAAEEVAQAMLMLMTNEYITGTVLHIDGGGRYL